MVLVKAFRQLVSVILVFELACPHVYAANNQSNNSSDPVNELAQKFSEAIQDPKELAHLEKIQSFADSLERGELKNANPEDFDTFLLSRQRVEILEKGEVVKTIPLSDFRIEIPALAYSTLRTVYNKETKELVFEGVRGANEDGSGGEVVARHIIPNLDLLTIARDKEIVTLVDRSGKLHAIDKGYVAGQVFKNPIPVVRNIWEPTFDVGTLVEVEAKYLTRGVQPYQESEVDEKSVISLDADKKPVFMAGDLLVRTKDSFGKVRVLGVFSREVTYTRLRIAAMYLMAEAALIAPNEEVIQQTQTILEEMNKTETKPEDLYESMDKVTKRFLLNLDKEQLVNLKNRFQKNTDYLDRRRDIMSYEEWLKSYEEILNNKIKASDVEESPVEKRISELEARVSELEKKDSQEARLGVTSEEENLARNWQKYVTVQASPDPLKKTPFEKLTNMVGKVFSMRVLAAMLTVGGIGYLTLPFVHDKYEALQQVMALNWMYEHYLFPVLKDLDYRSTLVLSMVSMLAIWPLAQASSWVSQNILRLMNSSVGKSTTKAANYIRDLAHNWMPLANWQRLTSFGMRIYAMTIYPAFRFAITYGLNQKSFYTAVQNGINPFKKIIPESEIGKELGLKESEYVGVNNPFLVGKKLESATDIKQKLLSKIAQNQESARRLAWILAMNVISQKEGIDPATLITVSAGKIDPQNLFQILSNKELKRDWYLMSEEIYQTLKTYEISTPDIEAVDPKEVAEFTRIAQDAANEIQQYSNTKKVVKELGIQFKRLPVWAFNNAPLIAGGSKEFEFLRSIYTSHFVSGQVYKEFVLDHISMAVIYSLIGARADMSHPENLAADSNGFLWTGRGNLYDMFFNTYAHFFVTGARAALVYQTVKAEDAKEYFPIEDYTYRGNEREQPFLSGAFEWVKEILTTTKSDLGHYFVKSFTKRFATIQSGIVMTSVFQGLLLHRSLDQAILAFSISFFAGQWFYGWVWDPVQRGNQMEEERFESMKEALENARYKISRGLREANTKAAQKRIQQGYRELFALYREKNPKALNKLLDMMKGNLYSAEERAILEKVQDLKLSLKKGVSEEEALYFGFLAELAEAIHSKDQERIKRARKNLFDFYVQKEKGAVTDQELRKLSARGLLEFTKAVPPIYTKPSALVTWLTTFGAAAGSTILATPYSVRITNDNYITVENLLFWVGVSAVLYPVIYLTLNKTTGNFLEKYITLAREKFFRRNTKQQEDFSQAENKDFQNKPQGLKTLSCSNLFAL